MGGLTKLILVRHREMVLAPAKITGGSEVLRKHCKVTVECRCLRWRGAGAGLLSQIPMSAGLLEPRELSLHHLQGQGTRGQLFLLRDQLLKLCSRCRGWRGRRAPLEQPSADSAPTFCALLRGPLCLKLSYGHLFLILQKKKKG